MRQARKRVAGSGVKGVAAMVLIDVGWSTLKPDIERNVRM